jgi:hypothetical protein
MRTVLKHNAEKGQLHSITDTAAQHTGGAQYVDKNGAHYEYGYNGEGSDFVQNRPCHRTWSTTGINPNWQAVATGDAFYQLVGIPQSAIPSTYWGWFHWKGPTTNRMYVDCVNHDGSLSVTDGQALAITTGVCANATLSLADEKDFAVVTETRNQLDVHVWLFGRVHLSAAT